MTRLARGSEPETVAADLAGDVFRRSVANLLGASIAPRPYEGDGIVDAAGEIIDVEAIPVDVADGVRRRAKRTK